MRTCKNCGYYDDVNYECGYDPNYEVTFDTETCVNNMTWQQRRDENGNPTDVDD